MVNGPRIAAIVLVCVAAVCNVVGLATNNWIKADGGHAGLWRSCGSSLCVDIPDKDVNNKLKAARGLTIFSVLLAVPSVAFLAISLSVKGSVTGRATRLPVLAMGLLFFQAILLAAGVGVGVKFFKDESKSVDIDYSVGIAATGSVLYLVAAILSGVSMRVAMTMA